MKNNRVKIVLCLLLGIVMLFSVTCMSVMASEIPDDDPISPDRPEVPEDHTHSFSDWKPIPGSTNMHIRHCECGTVDHEDCSFDDGRVTTKPTYESGGVKTYTCKVCGNTKTEPINKLDPGEPNPYEEEESYFWVIPVVVACVAASGTALCGAIIYRKNAAKKNSDGNESPTEDKNTKSEEKAEK